MNSKYLFVVPGFCFLSAVCGGQDSLSMHRRDVVWTTPVKKNTTINGIGIGLIQAVPWLGADSLRINGVNLDISLFGAFATCYALAGSVFAPFGDSRLADGDDVASVKIYPDTSSYSETRIRGLSVSIGGAGRSTKIDGVSVNGGVSFADEMHGFELTTLMNLHYNFKGLMIAGLRNKTTTGKGLQIALFNNCKAGQVVQIGLLNRIGNRILPVCNFSFKHKT